MNKKKIVQTIYSKIDEIPTLSPVLQKIVSLMQSSTSGAHDITEVISRDPSLTSKVLKVANSAYYGFAQTVDTLDRAVVLLGFNMISSLAMSAGIIRSLPADRDSDWFSGERLWIHSLAVATGAKELCNICGKKPEGDALFITGLLHDIGKVVLARFFAEDYQQVVEEAGCRGSAELSGAEEKYFGMDHGEVGSELLRRWNFPQAVIGPIALHHKKEVRTDINMTDIAILHIADSVSRETGMGVIEGAAPMALQESDMVLLGVNEAGIDSLKDHVLEASDGIHAFFKSLR